MSVQKACSLCWLPCMTSPVDGVQMPDLSAPAWPADRLVFLNDVYFCAGDLIRLLQHGESDMACGMDFIAWKSPPSTNDIQPYGPYGPPLSVSPMTAVSPGKFLTGPTCAAESCHPAPAAAWGALQSTTTNSRSPAPRLLVQVKVPHVYSMLSGQSGSLGGVLRRHMGGSLASRAVLQEV